MPNHNAFKPDGTINIPTQAAADYIAREGTLTAREPTMREKAVGALSNLIGGDDSTMEDRRLASAILGGDENATAMGIGMADFTPLGLIFGGDEAIRDFKKADSAVDYIAPTVGMGLTAVEAFPLTKIMTKPVTSFLSNLSRKIN